MRYEIVRPVDGPDGQSLQPGEVIDADDWSHARSLLDEGAIREADADAAPGGVKAQPEQYDTGQTAEEKAVINDAGVPVKDQPAANAADVAAQAGIATPGGATPPDPNAPAAPAADNADAGKPSTKLVTKAGDPAPPKKGD